MYKIFTHILFRNVIILIFAFSVLEKTGISVISQIFEQVQAKNSSFMTGDLENNTQETEGNKEVSLREIWVHAAAGIIADHPYLSEPKVYGVYDAYCLKSFYPSVPTPPPDLA